MQLIDGDMNKLGKFQHFQIDMKTLPMDIRERLISYLQSKDLGGKLHKVDCQIILDGFVELRKIG